MSAFLGPIHYWLYNKILWHEGLLEEIIDHAKSKEIPVHQILETVYAELGAPDLSPLETAIDHGNIHGWLQTRIQSVEGRIAAVVTALIEQYGLTIEEIEKLYRENGKKAGQQVITEIQTPQDLFNLVYDYMLEGMPCDRVNKVVVKTDEALSWETTDCLHKKFWEAAQGDVQNFYTLQDAWITSFVSTSDENYYYSHEKGGIKSIQMR